MRGEQWILSTWTSVSSFILSSIRSSQLLDVLDVWAGSADSEVDQKPAEWQGPDGGDQWHE